MLDKTGLDGPSRQPRVQVWARPCHKGKKIRPLARRHESFVHLFHHQLGSPEGTGAEPFVDEGDRAWQGREGGHRSRAFHHENSQLIALGTDPAEARGTIEGASAKPAWRSKSSSKMS